MACNPNIIGTMDLTAAGRVVPAAGRAVVPTDKAADCSAGTTFSLSARKASHREQAVIEVPILGLLLLVFAVSLLVAPDFHIRGTAVSLPLAYGCPLFTLTGIPCLLCGMTRSFLAMGGLDFGRAFAFHPLGAILFGVLAGLAATMAWSLARGRRIKLSIEPELRRRLIAGTALILIIAWVVKLVVWRRTGLI